MARVAAVKEEVMAAARVAEPKEVGLTAARVTVARALAAVSRVAAEKKAATMEVVTAPVAIVAGT